jgi:glycosyltransferase involved in cell wall biosynthesis
VLVMPYTSQTPTVRYMSPLKMFEYMAAGRPIVATDFPVVREVLRDGETAILVKPDSAQALREGIAGLLENDVEGRSIGEARSGCRHSVCLGLEGKRRPKDSARGWPLGGINFRSDDHT